MREGDDKDTGKKKRYKMKLIKMDKNDNGGETNVMIE